MKTKPVDYLTTYRAVLKVSGYLKTHDALVGFWITKDAPEGETRFPVETFKAIVETYGIRYSCVDPDTGYVEVLIVPEGLAKLWAIMDRVDVHTTSH